VRKAAGELADADDIIWTTDADLKRVIDFAEFVLKDPARAQQHWEKKKAEHDAAKVVQHPSYRARLAAYGAQQPAPQEEEDRRYRGYTADEYMSRTPPEWIIDGVLPQAELSFIVGEWGTGKTFFALDMAAAVARGARWRDSDTKRMRVVYICAEGAGGFRNRLEAYCQYHGVERKDLDLIVIPETPNLLQKKDVEALVIEIQRHRPVGWVIVDTLAQATAGGNENAGEDMGKMIANCKALHRATHANVTLVHHQGKDLGRGARGWSGLIGAADTEITLTGRTGLRTATISKQKEGQDGIRLQFTLPVVDLGKDAKGKEITSCAVEHKEGAQFDVLEPTGDNQKILWKVIIDLTKNDVPTVAEVLDEAVRRLPHDLSQEKDRRRNKMTMALNGLVANGWVEQEDGHVIRCK
jgi:putative DNA primase/helicase